MSTLAVTTAHTFVLTVSHGLLFHQPLDYLCNGRFCRRFLSSFTALYTLPLRHPTLSPSQSSVSIEQLWPNVVGSNIVSPNIVTTSTSLAASGSFARRIRSSSGALRWQTRRIHEPYDLSTI